MQLQQLLFAAASASAPFLTQLNQARNLHSSNPQPQPRHHITQPMRLATHTTRWFHTSAGDYINYSKRSHCRGPRRYHRYRGGWSYRSDRSYLSYINYIDGSSYITPAAATPPIQQRCSVLLQTAAAAANDACSCRAAAIAAAAADAAADAAAAAASTRAASHQLWQGSG